MLEWSRRKVLGKHVYNWAIFYHVLASTFIWLVEEPNQADDERSKCTESMRDQSVLSLWEIKVYWVYERSKCTESMRDQSVLSLWKIKVYWVYRDQSVLSLCTCFCVNWSYPRKNQSFWVLKTSLRDIIPLSCVHFYIFKNCIFKVWSYFKISEQSI